MDSTDTQYRRATKRDVDEVRQLLESVRGDRTEFCHTQFLVACAGSTIIGCVRIKELTPTCRELASLAVVAEWRGRGIGSALVSEIVATERNRPLFLLCADEMEAFYCRLGWVVIASIDGLPGTLQGEYRRIQTELTEMRDHIIAMLLE